MTDTEIVDYLIANNDFVTIATADADGTPWISPVFFVMDEQKRFYWVSHQSAQHSQNIEVRPEVALSIYGLVPSEDYVDGIYIDATAIELTDDADIEHAIAVRNGQEEEAKFQIGSIADVTGEAAWRIYRATPKVVYKRADKTDPASGQAITTRRVVEW